MTIKKQGSKFCVFSKDGKKKLGCHPTREKALKQLRAVEASKSVGKSLRERNKEYAEAPIMGESTYLLMAYHHLIDHIHLEKTIRMFS